MTTNGAGQMDPNERPRDSGEVAAALINAAFRGDVAAATALCAPDVVLRMEGVQVVRGHDGITQVMEFNEQVSSEVRVEIHRILSSGDTAAINRTTYLTIGGQRIELGVGSFFTVRDGLVTEWIDHQDMGDVTRALGH